MVDGCTNGLAVRLNRTFADIIITTASPAVTGCAATPRLSVIVAIYTNAGRGGKSDVDWAIGIEQSVFVKVVDHYRGIAVVCTKTTCVGQIVLTEVSVCRIVTVRGAKFVTLVVFAQDEVNHAGYCV